jgi:methionyl-tRNA formyltransferase
VNVKSVLLLSSRGDEADRIAEFCRMAFSKVEVHQGDWGDPLPEASINWSGDLIISYCSRWIIHKYLLEKASFTAINFHPAPPAYPGVGGLNWALYNNDSEFGITCHHMNTNVDAGPIIAVRSFPILFSDRVESLYRRAHLHLESLAQDILRIISNGGELPVSSLQWSGKPRTRKELNKLAVIETGMSSEEAARRIRATHFGSWKPLVKVAGYTFELKLPYE